MTPMYLPGTAAVIDDVAAAEAELVRVTAITRPAPVAIVASPASLTGTARRRALPYAGDPDLFFTESPDDGKLAKSLCSDCPIKPACLAETVERREQGGTWRVEPIIHGNNLSRQQQR